MTADEFMEGHGRGNGTVPEISGSDLVLALSRNKDAAPGSYLVFTGASEIKAEVLSELAKRRYFLNGGSVHRKTAVRKFSVIMKKDKNDPLQALLCTPDILFGTEQKAVLNYIYFDAVSGSGEKGTVTADVICDSSGGAGEPVIISAEFYGCGKPPEAITVQRRL